MKKVLFSVASALVMSVMMLSVCSCTENEPGFVIPFPAQNTTNPHKF